MSKLWAEFSGTFFLLAVVVGSGIMGESISGGNNGIALLINTISTGAALYVLITLLGPLSGAHFNPLVSAMCCLWGHLDARMFLKYVAAQLLGAVCGVLFAHLMFGLPLVQTGIKVREGVGILSGEFLATFGLLAVIMLAERFSKDKVALLVALYITSAYLFTSSTSFANPAVTIARSFTATFAGIAPHSVMGFLTAEVTGLVIAMLLLHCRPQKGN